VRLPAGALHPYFFGWMVHVYPYVSDPAKIWSTSEDEEGHDNLDHSAMPGIRVP
jgi:hypothetical protein